jgi:hypothetical protein
MRRKTKAKKEKGKKRARHIVLKIERNNKSQCILETIFFSSSSSSSIQRLHTYERREQYPPLALIVAFMIITCNVQYIRSINADNDTVTSRIIVVMQSVSLRAQLVMKFIRRECLSIIFAILFLADSIDMELCVSFSFCLFFLDIEEEKKQYRAELTVTCFKSRSLSHFIASRRFLAAVHTNHLELKDRRDMRIISAHVRRHAIVFVVF